MSEWVLNGENKRKKQPRSLPVSARLQMVDAEIPVVERSQRPFGLVINKALSWSDYIDDVWVFMSCARNIGMLKTHILDKKSICRIYTSVIRSRPVRNMPAPSWEG